MLQTVRRIVLVVLDGIGVGALPDAAAFGASDADVAANCLRNTARAVGGLTLPILGSLGIGVITDIAGTSPAEHIRGCCGKMAEVSRAKDSTTGHWEIAGVITEIPFPTYPQGFPTEVLQRFEAAIGRKTLGNYPASGTAIIAELGAQHLQTGFPIVYTSADSVFQIATHEEVVAIEELYRWCAIARAQLTPPHGVGRVIARPFIGIPGQFIRTGHRRDFALPPPQPTILSLLRDAGFQVIGLGKIGDLFSEQGLSYSEHPVSDDITMLRALEFLRQDWHGLLFVNVVDCDQAYGHRRNPVGYATSLQRYDVWLGQIISELKPDDILFVTGDHGTDPTVAGSDHTREFVPILGYGSVIRSRVLGDRSTFADLGATIVEALSPEIHCAHGVSFWPDIIA